VKKLYVSIADTDEKRAYGLMNRKALDFDKGMLFKFPYPHHLKFWMKKTYIPLDIAFIDDDLQITQIASMSPLNTNQVMSQKPCRYAIEVNRGWFEKNKVKEGCYITGVLKKDMKLISKVTVEKDDNKPKEKIDLKVDDEKEPEIKEDSLFDKDNDINKEPPEIEVEGEYPESVYTAPETPEGEANPEIQAKRDLRGNIKLANDNNLDMEIIYWTLRGHMLPPRRVKPIPGEGYSIRSGKSGEYLVAFDNSPTIQGQGWSIKGLQPKSFILDNIIKLQIFDKNGKQLDDQTVQQAKDSGGMLQEKSVQQQPQQPQQKQPTMFERLKNVFKRK
jgi:uncharacterized protein